MTDLLAKHRRAKPVKTGSEAAPAPEATEPQRVPYEAYRVSATEKRHLEIRLRDPAPAEAPSNMLLTHVRGEWRDGCAIALKYGNTMLVEIEGKRLTDLFRALQNWKVEFIAEFDPDNHALPEKNCPYIETIRILKEPPPVPPPMEKRH